MTKVRTIKLIGPALDWAVMLCEHEGRAEGWLKTYLAGGDQRFVQTINDSPSTNWDQGGPIIEREKIETRYISPENGYKAYWQSQNLFTDIYGYVGHTVLISAMRCHVAGKFGDMIEIPDELIEE